MLYALHAFIVPYFTARKAKVIAGSLLGTTIASSLPWLIALLALTGPDGTAEGLKLGIPYFVLSTCAALAGALLGLSRGSRSGSRGASRLTRPTISDRK
jgi:hypothetical protein